MLWDWLLEPLGTVSLAFVSPRSTGGEMLNDEWRMTNGGKGMGVPTANLTHLHIMQAFGISTTPLDPLWGAVILPPPDFSVESTMLASFVDIHCHLLPGIDDGAADWDATLAMAQMAVADGMHTIIATPHQQGNFAANRGDDIRRRTAELQQVLNQSGIPLTVLPGADVRIEDGMIERLASGEVLTLADRRRHVLLELPHELYFPLEPLLVQLKRHGMDGILSHPERNRGILSRPELIGPLIGEGCLMQVTAGSLMGTFGPESQRLAKWMLQSGLIHFLATDAHSPVKRRPLMQRAYQRVAGLAGEATARRLCIENPARVARGESVPADLPTPQPSSKGWQAQGWRGFFSTKKAG